MRRTQVLVICVFLTAVLSLGHYGFSIVSHSASMARVAEAQERLLLPRPYLFIHVPKSGGTSLGKLAELEENGGGDRFIVVERTACQLDRHAVLQCW